MVGYYSNFTNKVLINRIYEFAKCITYYKQPVNWVIKFEQSRKELISDLYLLSLRESFLTPVVKTPTTEKNHQKVKPLLGSLNFFTIICIIGQRTGRAQLNCVYYFFSITIIRLYPGLFFRSESIRIVFDTFSGVNAFSRLPYNGYFTI